MRFATALSNFKELTKTGSFREIQSSAQNLLALALEMNLILRPYSCECCGRPCVPHGHHINYLKPLSVEWLCDSCHRKAHSFGKTKLVGNPGKSHVQAMIAFD